MLVDNWYMKNKMYIFSQEFQFNTYISFPICSCVPRTQMTICLDWRRNCFWGGEPWKKEVIWVHPILPDRRALSATQWNPWSGCTGGVKPGGYVSLAEGWNFSRETNEKMGRTIKVLQTEGPLRTVYGRLFLDLVGIEEVVLKFQVSTDIFQLKCNLPPPKGGFFGALPTKKKMGQSLMQFWRRKNFILDHLHRSANPSTKRRTLRIRSSGGKFTAWRIIPFRSSG